MKKRIDETIHDFIIENFLYGDRSTPLGPEDSFLERGIIDSTGVLELVAFLESIFGITVADEDIIPDNLDSISKVTRYIRHKQNTVTHAG